MSKIGHLYLIQEREFINTDKPIYKIGMSKNIDSRMKHYPKKSKLILIIESNDVRNDENKLKKVFDEKFKNRTDIGREYYEGNIKLIKQEFISTILANNVNNDVNNVSDNKDDSKLSDNLDDNVDDNVVDNVDDNVVDNNDNYESDDTKLIVNIDNDSVLKYKKYNVDECYNYETDTLNIILDKPVINLNGMFNQPMGYVSDHGIMPDFNSIPVIDKLHKNMNQCTNQIKKVISKYYTLTDDVTDMISLNVFRRLWETLPNYMMYLCYDVLLHMVISKLYNYKSFFVRGNCEQVDNVYSYCITSLKLKSEFVLDFKIRIDTIDNLMNDFIKIYGYVITQTGIKKYNRTYDTFIKKMNHQVFKCDKSDIVFDIKKIYKICNDMLNLPFKILNINHNDLYLSSNALFEYFIKSSKKDTNVNIDFQLSNGEVILVCFILGCKFYNFDPPNVDINIFVDLNHPVLLDIRKKYKDPLAIDIISNKCGYFK